MAQLNEQASTLLASVLSMSGMFGDSLVSSKPLFTHL